MSIRDAIDVDAMQPRKVTGEELEVALADRTKPLIIDFYADWCGPCVLLAKELEQVRIESRFAIHFVRSVYRRSQQLQFTGGARSRRQD
jgi:thioredoxin-like negative regulator of GroEL